MKCVFCREKEATRKRVGEDGITLWLCEDCANQLDVRERERELEGERKRPTGLTIIVILWVFGSTLNLSTSLQSIINTLEVWPLLSDPGMSEWFKFAVPAELAIILFVFALGIIQVLTAFGLMIGKSWSYKLALAIPVLALIGWLLRAALYMSAPLYLGLEESLIWVSLGSSILGVIIFWSYLRQPHVKRYLRG